MVVKIDTLLGDAAAMNRQHDAAGNADHSGFGRNILGDHRVGTNAGVMADGDGTENLGAGADQHAISKSRMALAGIPGDPAEGHTVIKGHIVADLGGLADHHATAMIDEEAPANGGAGMDVDLADEPRQKAQQPGQIAPAPAPQSMGQAMDQQGMDAGIGGEHLEMGAGSGISTKHAAHILAQQLEQPRSAGGSAR